MFIKYITLISALNYLIFGLVALLRKSPLRKINVLLGFVFLLMSAYSILIYYYHLAFEVSDLETINLFIPVEQFFCLSMGPLFYYYVRKLLNLNCKLFSKTCLVFAVSFLPALIYNIYVLSLSSAERVILLTDDYYNGIWQTQLLNVIFYIQMTIALIKSYILIRRQKKIGSNIIVNNVIYNLQWLYELIIIDIVYMLFSFPFVISFPAGFYTNVIAQLAMGIQFIYIFWRIVWHNGLYSNVHLHAEFQDVAMQATAISQIEDKVSLQIEENKESGLKLSEEMVEVYTKKLDEYVLANQSYLNVDCTIQTISEGTGITIHHISYVLNAHKGKSFSDYINEYRIRKAKQLLQSEKFDGKTLETLCYECGFGSKSNFNKVFKKATELTPSQYKKECRS